MAGAQQNTLTTLVSGLVRETDQPVIIQSLHLIAGSEFHRLAKEAMGLNQPYQLGLPLLNEPADYDQLSRCLKPVISGYPKAPVVLLGHGTNHPAWTAYPALENVLRKTYGKEIYVRGLDGHPRSEHLFRRLKIQNPPQVVVIPLLLVTGVHFQRDIAGAQSTSWKSQLFNHGIEMMVHRHGLANLAGIETGYIAHIKAALQRS